MPRNTPHRKPLEGTMNRLGPLLVLALLATAAPAAAAPLPVSGTLDLARAPAEQAARHTATERDGLAGAAVAGVGDFDGDGTRDIAVGEPKRDTAAGADSGVVHVVLDAGTSGDLGDAERGITIRGAQAGDQAGFDVAAAGDVNRDGLADLLVGAPLAGGRPEGSTVGGGEAYVVFGRAGRAEIDLAARDFGGIRITGGDVNSWLGRAVASLPDVNGDGVPEIVVGAPRRDVADRPNAGSVYVVFGRATGDVDAARLVEDGAGFRIDGPGGSDRGGAFAGRAVSSVGDLDGDGRPEVLLTAPQAATGASGVNGAAYVVRGRSEPGVVDLQQLGDGGFVVSRTTPRDGDEGRSRGDWLGESISGLGDVNGDGLPDFVVGAHLADGPNRPRGGIAFVVFGKADTDPVDLGSLGAAGYRIIGVGRQDQTGFSTAPAGDFNGDGIQDIAISAPFADPLSRASAGAVYVVYGRTGTAAGTVDLFDIGTRGIRIVGRVGSATGFTIDGAGDVDGDGGGDLVIGAPAVDEEYPVNLRSERPGRAWVVFGATGRPGEIPGEELREDPGYGEALAAGCTPAINVQAVIEDNGYTDQEADPDRIRMTGLQAFVATPRNFGTVLGVTGFRDALDEEDVSADYDSVPIVMPTELQRGNVGKLKRQLADGVEGEDPFPGYGPMFRALAIDNPAADAKIMLVDGFLFRALRRLKGLTRGSAPTYVIAVGDPPDRNRVDISEMKRLTRNTKGRYYEARSSREIERALQAIQSRLRCDIEADNYQEELQATESEEIAEVDLDEDTHCADVTITWRDDDERYEIEEIEVLDDDGDLVDVIDEEELEEAYEADDERGARAAQAALPRVVGGRGQTFRSLHIRRLSGDRQLRVVVRSANKRSRGRVFARITQSRNRR